MKRFLSLVCVCFLLAGCGRLTDPTSQRQPVTTPESGAALVQQAVSLLRERYVAELSSADLYAAAYQGATSSAQAAGIARLETAPEFTGEPEQDAARFEEAYLALARAGGESVDQTLLAYESIREMTAWIDECHTSFLTPQQYQQLTASLEGRAEYGGIGVSIRPQTRPVVISEVFPDTPAARSGLQPGDAILAVNGTDVTNLPAEQIGQLVRGPEGTEVTLTIQRPGEPAPRDVTLIRARVTIPVLTTRIERAPNGEQIGYIRLYSFSTGAEQQLQQALEEFARQGVTGWVLDLRNNGGGFVTTLTQIAGRFIKGGKPVAYVTDRSGRVEPILAAEDVYFTPQQPLAILINGGSASSSEALSAAAQDYGFARLFGETTAGCLAAAKTFQLRDGSALQITVEEVVSPERRQINQVGVEPDVRIEPRASASTDPVLDAALRWLAEQR